MEVIRCAKHTGLALGHSLDLVSPLTGNLDGGLDGLGTRVHGQYHVIAEGIADFLGPNGEDVIVECARSECDSASLLGKGLDQLWVTVALVDSTVGREKIEVVLALGIPHVDPLGPCEDDGQRVVVVCCVLVLGRDGRRRRGCVVPAVGSIGLAIRDAVFCVWRHVDGTNRWTKQLSLVAECSCCVATRKDENRIEG